MFLWTLLLLSTCTLAQLMGDDLEAKEQQLNLCSSPGSPLIPPVCPYADGGPFHFICGSYPYSQAADLCASYGWRLAPFTSDNANLLSQVLINCTNPRASAWVASVHGLPADPCALIISGFFSPPIFGGFLNYGTAYCEELAVSSRGVVCEEEVGREERVTASEFVGTEPSGETSTTTTVYRTRTVTPFSVGTCACTASASSDSLSFDTSSCDTDTDYSFCYKSSNTTPTCYTGDCLPACSYSSGGIHLITGLANYNDTAAECAKYGWRLLDYTNGRAFDLADVVQSCAISSTVAYINSFNGVFTNCTYVNFFRNGNGIVNGVGMVGDGSRCTTRLLPVFCQEECQFEVVEEAEEEGFVSVTTVVDTTLTGLTLTTPTRTVSVTRSCTETVFTR